VPLHRDIYMQMSDFAEHYKSDGHLARNLKMSSDKLSQLTSLYMFIDINYRCVKCRKVFKLRQVQESEPSFQEEMFAMSYVLITDLDLREYAGRTILQSAHHQTHQFYCSQDSVLPELESTCPLDHTRIRDFVMT
jgi:hypothetical protein